MDSALQPGLAMDGAVRGVGLPAALQQPQWGDPSEVELAKARLGNSPSLVDPTDITLLRESLASVAQGEALVLQSGDCAEDPADSTREAVQDRVDFISGLAGALSLQTGLPVLRVGRLGGQYAKPRSSATECAGGVELPVYRGHMVNGAEPTWEARQPDPWRMVECYRASQQINGHLKDLASAVDGPLWTSHEALLLDYELSLVRRNAEGHLFLASTHFPWIGERTRHPGSAHVQLLSRVANPVGCKIGPTATVDDVLELCRVLDPLRAPGRLTLIARLGADRVEAALPPLVRAVGRAGHRVTWLVDPMHANTITSPWGRKTRVVETVAREVRAFCSAVRAGGGFPGGLHLEASPDDITECISIPGAYSEIVESRYRTFCDPRLNRAQAQAVVAVWPAAASL